MQLPVDTSAVNFVSAGAAESNIDVDTTLPMIYANGSTLMGVDPFNMGEGGTPDVISVKIPGQVRGSGHDTNLREVVGN